ncbi:DUF3305 domain-containing protein [Rhabdaerophilum calidifontis]|uniref:DUF3305 domain-containing protein n=1 Tax=Rhabdaerophilum calidifontis TaxID=2604328 RepID=UPI00123BCF55|nr:DUF3305 domain-containing protein [Rhabdaerophilum calidifontis]
MPEMSIPVGVIAEKRKAASPWIDHTWSVEAVLTGIPAAARMTLIARDETGERYYVGAENLVFSSVETARYRDNLLSGAPKLWVVMREDALDATLTLVTVTADPAEGEAHAESEANLVGTVPMAPEIAAALAAFVDEHHVERDFFKRKRDRADPDGLGRRRPGRGGDHGG